MPRRSSLQLLWRSSSLGMWSRILEMRSPLIARQSHSDKVLERFWHMTSSFAVGILGFVIAISTMNVAARYVSLLIRPLPPTVYTTHAFPFRFLMAQSYAGFVCMYAWMSNSFPRPPSKRAVALALINAVSQTGNVAGSVSSSGIPP